MASSSTPSAPPQEGSTAPSAPSVSREVGTLTNDPSRTGFDPQTNFWINYFNHLTGRMTPEGSYHFREDAYRRREADDVARCERDRDWLLRYSPTVRFLADRIAALDGKLDATNIRCQRCPTLLAPDGTVHRRGGGFNKDIGILICANEIRDRRHLEDTMAHEMVHAWDHLRWKVDFDGEKDLRQAACTEIRAAMLSGECRWAREFFTRHNWKLSQQFQNCVRMRAIMSVNHRLTCKDDVQATKVVNQVWDSCFADTRPFDEVYR